MVDQIFVKSDDSHYRYHGTRGGGTVWNILAYLAQAGYQVKACGMVGDDLQGEFARSELHALRIDVSHVVAMSHLRTLTFSQFIPVQETEFTTDPQRAFSTTCPVCTQAPNSEEIATFLLSKCSIRSLMGHATLMCADRLTVETAEAARQARQVGVIATLDLGGYDGLGDADGFQLMDWYRMFQVISMPHTVASWLIAKAHLSSFAELLEDGPSLLAITKGHKGFDLHCWSASGKRQSWQSQAPEVTDLVDESGAGDAFMAALLDEVMSGNTIRERNGDLLVDDQKIEALLRRLRDAPIPALSGIGARAAFPEFVPQTKWLDRLTAMRGRTVQALKRTYGHQRPCLLCGL